MEKSQLKCSYESHKENDAISFCYNCKIYMCHKCEKLHSDLFSNHFSIKLGKDKNIDDLFTGLCKEENHSIELKYFCKSHNKLCCAECITKFKGKNHGQHTDCTICSIEDIKNEKMNKLNENIKTLEELSTNLQESIKEIKIIFEKNEKKKEELKLEIQKVFTKIRTAINDREDELLLEIDKDFNELFLNENIIQDSEKLPNKIKISLDKGKSINNNLENSKLNSLINDCLNIENNINDISKINQSMKKYKSSENNIIFKVNENDNQKLFEFIRTFGHIYKPISEILKYDDFIKINEMIGCNNEFIIKFNAKRDDCNTDIFHKNCDGICGCLFICKIDSGDILGAYLTAKIKKSSEYSDDNKAFLFNLTQNIIKKNKKSFKNAIQNCGDSSYFIKFGNNCKVFYLDGNCLNSNNSFADTCGCEANYDCKSTNLLNNTSNKNFKVENFEVFEVKSKI